jgi:uncharacterized protein YjaG (DUF416 family)
MNDLRFDEPALLQRLERLPRQSRTIFAAAVAERLLPAYVNYWKKASKGNPTRLTAILEQLWKDLDGSKTSEEAQQESIDLCISLIPSEDSDPWFQEQVYADDAAAALAYALRSRESGNAQEAAWAARRAYEALDQFVIVKEDVDTHKPGAEQIILAHPIIQAELARQNRDLLDLAASRSDISRIADQIRQRAKAEAETLFDQPAN